MKSLRLINLNLLMVSREKTFIFFDVLTQILIGISTGIDIIIDSKLSVDNRQPKTDN